MLRVGCLNEKHFSTLCQKGYYFQKKKNVIEHKMCVSIFSTNLSETFAILRRNERDMVVNLYWSSCKLNVIPVRFSWILNSLERFWTNNQITKF